MGLMFARRRIEEAKRRAALKAEAHKERKAEMQAKHQASQEADKQPKAPKGKNGADDKGTK